MPFLLAFAALALIMIATGQGLTRSKALKNMLAGPGLAIHLWAGN